MSTNTPELTADERLRAIQEADRIAAADSYFEGHPSLDTYEGRRIYAAAFDRAYALLSRLRQGGETVAGTPVDGEAQRPATISFVNGAAAPCGCTIRFSDGGGEYSDVHYVTLCGTHSGAALLSKVIKTGELTRPQHEDLEGEICAALAAPQASADARNQWMEEAAAAIEAHQREGRQWVPGSLWDTLSREAAARIRALKFTAAPQPAEAHDLEDGAHDRDNYLAAHADEQDAAERYRWLRDLDWYAEPRIDEEDGTMWKVTFYTPARIEDPTDDDSLDTAIDAARAAVLADRQQRAALASKEKNDAK